MRRRPTMSNEYEMKTDIGGVAGQHVGAQSLETAGPHLAEVTVQNAHVEERRSVHKFEELDVVAAVECGVDANSKLHLVRLADIGTQLLHFSAVNTQHYHYHKS